jgi:uncharacterized membrane protein YccC
MSAAGAIRPSLWQSFPVDLGWRNLVFSLRTAIAGVIALAIAFWLEMRDPQWSILTVYLLAQPTAGAAVAKGVYRIFGTVLGAAMGLVILALYAQFPVPLVGSVALWLGICFYVAARRSNYSAYAFMLAGYTGLLVALEGASDPVNAWSIAFDRTGEIVIGIICVTAASAIVMPRYAGVMLREQMAQVFRDLAHFGAVALRPGVPFGVFVALRRTMVGALVSFDALRSYAVFEAPALRADDAMLRRVIRDFLRVLGVARGLYLRIEDFRVEGAGPIVERLKPAVEEAAVTLDRIAAETAPVDPRRLRTALLAARAGLGAAAAELESMAGRVPFEPLADGLLVLRRAGDLLHGLSMVMVSEAASLRARRPSAARRRPEILPGVARTEAALVGLRAALALISICGIWAATEWNEGFVAVTGVGLMLFFSVNQDRPGPLAFAFLIWSTVAIALAYAAMVLVLPRIEGYEALALFLVVALLPGGLMAGTPRYAWPGIALAGFLANEIGTSNRFQPDELAFFNSNLAFLGGMALCLVYLKLFPVDSLATRGRVWTEVMGRLLPEAARGARHERAISAEIYAMLAELLPRLALDRQEEEDFLRGTLGAASMSLELGRLDRLRREPGLPAPAAAAVATFLTRFAGILETVPRARERIAAVIAGAEAAVGEARAVLRALPLEPGSPAAALAVRAGASLRFIADRFDIDRGFLVRSFDARSFEVQSFKAA